MTTIMYSALYFIALLAIKGRHSTKHFSFSYLQYMTTTTTNFSGVQYEHWITDLASVHSVGRTAADRFRLWRCHYFTEHSILRGNKSLLRSPTQCLQLELPFAYPNAAVSAGWDLSPACLHDESHVHPAKESLIHPQQKEARLSCRWDLITIKKIVGNILNFWTNRISMWQK